MTQGTITGVPKDTDPTLSANSDLFIPSQKAVKTYVDTSVAAGTVLSRIGSSTYSTTQHLMNAALSPGLWDGGNITVSGTANAVDVAKGTGFLRATDSNVATESFFNWNDAPAVSVPLNTTRFIGIIYNAGVPIVTTKTTDTWDLDTEFPLGVVVNEGGTRYITANPWITGDNMANVIERFDSIAFVTRDNRVGGLILSNTGTRNVMVSASALLSRMSEFTIPTINTSGLSTFDAYYQNGSGGFTKQSAQTQWNNTQYDDGTGALATLTAGFYTSRWFYVMTDGSLAMLYGRNNSTTLADALNDGTPSNAPDRITEEGLLIGRFIIQKSAATPTTTQTVFETNFSSSGVTDFSSLSGFATPSQGGTGIPNNNASTLTITGSFPITLTVSAPTSLTLPTSGTVATLSNHLGQFASTTSAQLASTISDETGTGALVFANSPTFITPALGTPSSGVATNLTGTAAGLTAGTVTTNANLTGAVTSVGNATSLGSFTSAQLAAALTNETGTGAAVFATSPTFVTPALGTPSSGVATNLTGTAAGLTAGTVTTNANLTGAVTSVGNATSLGSFTSAQLATALTDETGTGANVFATAPTLVTPVLGTPTSGTLTNCTGLPIVAGTTGTLTVARGGTGVTTLTNHGVVIGAAAGAVNVTSAGTAGQILTSNGAAADPTFQAASSGVTKFTSTNQTITSAGALTIAHGLGVRPVLTVVELVTGTAQAGYVAGDVVNMVGFGGTDITGTSDGGVSIVNDATNINVRYGSDANVFIAPNKTTGVSTALTNANFTMRVTVYNI